MHTHLIIDNDPGQSVMLNVIRSITLDTLVEPLPGDLSRLIDLIDEVTLDSADRSPLPS